MSNEWYDIDSWQWTDNEVDQWGFTEEGPIVISYEGLYHIWTDNKYVYAATSSGLDITDIETESRQSFVTNVNGYTTVWSDSEKIFVGSSAGIKVLNQSDVGPIEMLGLLTDYVKEPDITSNNIKYIHGNTNKLICCTTEGVDIIRRDSNYITHTYITGAQKCFITSNHDYLYYTISGTTSWHLCRLNNNNSDWLLPDIIYTTGSGFLEASSTINDFFVTEHTSISGVDNTLFIATNSGVYVYDEGADQYIVYNTTTPKILAGESTDFSAIWASSTASIESANMYVGSKGPGAAFSVVDLADRKLVDSYLIDKAGQYDELLEREDIYDINVSTIGV